MRLFGFERRWFVAIFEAILPAGGSELLPDGAAALPLARFADELVRYAPARQAFGLRGAAWLLTLFGAALAGRLRPFGWQTPAERAAVLERLSQHSVYVVRELPTLFKMLATMGYCGAPQVQRALGITRVDATPPSWMVES